MSFESKGKCVIFSAPSGAGKTTIVHALLEANIGLEFSISACSRDPRSNEIDGRDYYFLGIEGFHKKIEEKAFIEWEEVYTDNFYGTLRSEVERIWKNGNAAIFDVDVVGGLRLKQIFGKQALAIFVQPPSYDELERRLRFRSTETEEKIAQRMSKAREELGTSEHFDHILTNDDLDDAVRAAKVVVEEFLNT